MKDIPKQEVSFTLNHKPVKVTVSPHKRLLDVLREDFGLVGTKEGCAVGECGACTVIVDGDAVTSCLMLIGQVEGRDVITIEGVAEEDGTLDPIQEAILEHQAIQCGFCTPGFVMSAKALIDKNPHATLDEIRVAISGNLCRCTGYEQLAQAIYEAAQLRAAALAEKASDS
jgi:carbon-monoxide dehydrogenase small subunit